VSLQLLPLFRGQDPVKAGEDLRYSRLLARPALAALRSGLIGFFRKPPLAPAANRGKMLRP